tara:strand:+ start:142 stop:354 length:213 start_codon:yes stop_codon:yes gene_type:complete
MNTSQNDNNNNYTFEAIQYILNKNNKSRKINKNDLFFKNNLTNKKHNKLNTKIPSYRKQKEFGLNKFIKP